MLPLIYFVFCFHVASIYVFFILLGTILSVVRWKELWRSQLEICVQAIVHLLVLFLMITLDIVYLMLLA